jgi:hypothetical protein
MALLFQLWPQWRLGGTNLFALAETGGFTFEASEIVELGPAYAPGTNQIYMVDHWRMHRKNPLDTLSEAYLANGDGFAETDVLAGDNGPFESLQTLFVTFPDTNVHPNCIPRAKLRMCLSTNVLAYKLADKSILHKLILPFIVPGD